MAESEASLDEQLELKKRARRRLVGASALAVLAAIVLPMVMDHEPRPASQDIQVRIPSQDGTGFATRILPAKPAATPLPPAAPVAEAKPAPEPKAETKPEPKAEAVKEPAKAEAPKAAAVVPAPAKQVEKPADKPAEKAAAAKPPEKVVDKPAAKPQDKPAEKKADEARAADALAGASADQWVVQLGAYKEAGNVKLLLSKLKGMGVAAYTEKFDSPQGPRTRVRAGPYPSRDAAEKARTKIKIIGVDGPVAPK
ncbi:MAG: SPOR domain-containing protein [Rhodocyclaceae bacterium]|nr:SPOR domain-containing protein [Rhodocyclaceae bacterium]